MKKKSILSILGALMAALMFVLPVFAEGELSPAETPAETAPEEPAPVDEMPAEPEAEPAPAEIHADIPALVVLDEKDQPLPLASRESAEILAMADPYYYFGGVKMEFFGVTGIQDAIDDIVSNNQFPDDGYIYVENGTYNGFSVNAGLNAILASLRGVVSENGSVSTQITSNVTINGVLAGFLLQGFNITGGVAFENTAGNLVLNDLDVHNTGGRGIAIGANGTKHNGNVTMTSVNAHNSSQTGAYVNNTGNVSVSNSAFNSNGDRGLFINTSTGTITLKGVTANGNTNYGIMSINFTKAVTLQYVTANDTVNGPGLHFEGSGAGLFKGDHIYANDNGSAGMYLDSTGAITLSNLVISGNDVNFGLQLNHPNSAAPISLSNASISDNQTHGLLIETLGNVLLTSVKVENNTGYGASIYNGFSGALGTITITSPAAAGGLAANAFSGNSGGFGLKLQSNKNISLTNLDAMENSSDGAWIVTPGNLLITKNIPNWGDGFDNNGNDGLKLEVGGNVTMYYAGASNNAGYGANFSTASYVPNTVTITRGMFDGNAMTGLYLNSKGSVTLTDVESASNNDWEPGDILDYSGIAIDNTYGVGNVTIRSTSTSLRTQLSNNTYYGLYVESNGAISVGNLFAESNGLSGVHLKNNLDGVLKPISATRITSNENGSITDGGMGLDIWSFGNVLLQDLSIYKNAEHGLRVEACEHSGMGCVNLSNITMRGTNSFSSNGMQGFLLIAKGAITISHLDSQNNLGGGGQIANNYEGSAAAVSVGGTARSSVSGNRSFGIEISSFGNITLKNMDVVNNYFEDYYLFDGAANLTNDGSGVHSVTVSNCSFFNNEFTGLFIQSNGPVTLNDVDSSFNSISSGWIDVLSSEKGVIERLNHWDGYDTWWFDGVNGAYYDAITLTSTEFTPVLELYDAAGTLLASDPNNSDKTSAQITYTLGATGDYYLRVSAKDNPLGTYTLTLGIGTLAPINRYDGVYVDTDSALLVTSATSSNTFNTFNENNGNGIYAFTGGNVTLTNTSASRNGVKGANVDTLGNVLVYNNHPTLMSGFSHNTGDGLYLKSDGTITLNNRITLFANGDDGVEVDYVSGAPKNVAISKVWAQGNNQMGLKIGSDGNVTLTSVNVLYNGQDGINLTCDGNITMLGSNLVSNNGNYGIYAISSNGLAAINNLVADGNDGPGISLTLNGAGKTAFLKNVTTRQNDGDAIQVVTHGAITLDGVISLMNGGDGVYLQSLDFPAITIKNSVFISNDGNGIEANVMPVLLNTLYYGNGDTNLNVP